MSVAAICALMAAIRQGRGVRMSSGVTFGSARTNMQIENSRLARRARQSSLPTALKG
ncbi:MAG: hypothetical protein FD149_2533 [Rhodospirillaceae bacterium]|nr:MAG: hypothetical protein FD149_2533 [Rhodospirillaceae bacterium]